MDLSPDKKWLIVAGKEIPLRKYDYKKFNLIKSTKSSKHPIQFEISFLVFKCISMQVDKYGLIWIHDAITRNLLTFDSDLKFIHKIPGNAISLCTSFI